MVNKILSWYFRKRHEQIKMFTHNPIDIQNDLLFSLLEFAKNTEFGLKYNFASIKTYSDFASRLPLTKYEDIYEIINTTRLGKQNIFWPTEVTWFAKSSGTTNAKSKFIPISKESLEDCHYKAGRDMLSIYLTNNPESQLFSGKMLRLGGNYSQFKNGKSQYGDLSAILMNNLPFWAEYSSAPSISTSLLDNWEDKITAIVNETKNENIVGLAGVPSWMLLILKEIIAKKNAKNLLEVWPNIETYFHGGVNFTPFKNIYNSLIPSDKFNYYEVYNASEGFFAIQDKNNSNEMLLMLDYGVFYEFISMDQFHSENPKYLTLNEVELDKNYAIIITTNAGLWRYIIGDTIKFTSLSPFRIRITGRTKYFINAFGEELIAENAEMALEEACQLTKSTLKEYTASPVFMTGSESGAHEWIIEFEVKPQSIKAFTDQLDKSLKKLNSDYEAKRTNNLTLRMPIVHVARSGLFYSWMKERGRLGGQNKVPRLSNNRDHIDALLKLNNSKVINF